MSLSKEEFRDFFKRALADPIQNLAADILVSRLRGDHKETGETREEWGYVCWEIARLGEIDGPFTLRLLGDIADKTRVLSMETVFRVIDKVKGMETNNPSGQTPNDVITEVDKI